MEAKQFWALFGALISVTLTNLEMRSKVADLNQQLINKTERIETNVGIVDAFLKSKYKKTYKGVTYEINHGQPTKTL